MPAKVVFVLLWGGKLLAKVNLSKEIDNVVFHAPKDGLGVKGHNYLLFKSHNWSL